MLTLGIDLGTTKVAAGIFLRSRLRGTERGNHV